MIIGKDLNPERQVYYISGLILSIIKNSDNEIDFFKVFQEINKKEDISINLYTLSLDWLFVLGIINQNGGNIIKCL